MSCQKVASVGDSTSLSTTNCGYLFAGQNSMKEGKRDTFKERSDLFDQTWLQEYVRQITWQDWWCIIATCFPLSSAPKTQFTVTSSTVLKFLIYNVTFVDKAISKRRWHHNIIRANPERGMWLAEVGLCLKLNGVAVVSCVVGSVGRVWVCWANRRSRVRTRARTTLRVFK